MLHSKRVKAMESNWSGRKFVAAKAKAVTLSEKGLVTGSYPDGQRLPLVLEPVTEGVSLPIWVKQNRSWIETELSLRGAILFRGFRIHSVKDFSDFAASVSNELIVYNERSSPRTELAHGIYTSTDYPAHQRIALHSEQSYTLNWPMKIVFGCLQPAKCGGQTPIASNRNILKRLDESVRQEFGARQVTYIRNYNQGLGLTWQEAFQTNDRRRVETYCCRSGIVYNWTGRDRLRTRQIRPAITTHPRTGEELWFNHIHFFNVSSLEESVSDAMLSVVKEEDFPYYTTYGDGTRIDPSVRHEIARAYAEETVRFAWQQNDVLLLDNMLCAHSREPFIPPRQVVAAMADPWAALKQEIYE
jgi:alpha-ketoglutarate-dependent taurine dioxygenase